MISTDWATLKAFLDDRDISAQYVDLGTRYRVVGIDGPFSLTTNIDKNPTDTTDLLDFETNYKSAGNAKIQPVDTDGAALQRAKITQSGWHYQIHGLEFTTGKLGSAFNEDCMDTNLGFLTVKYYDSNDTELVAGTQAELDASCVKTVADFMPDYDFDIIGGTLEQAEAASSDVRLWVIAVPGLPGGDLHFTQGGINLRHVHAKIEIDGKTAKRMYYMGGIGSNKFRIVTKHGLTVQHPVHMLFKLYKA